MEYIDVTWNHTNMSYPIRLVSELGSDRYEIRKLEFYQNGQVGFATEELSSLGAELSEKPIPLLEVINSDLEFKGKYITAEEFEGLWECYVQ